MAKRICLRLAQVFYWLLIAPWALINRNRKIDPLRLRIDRTASTYWED